MAEVDSLSIKINAEASTANKAIVALSQNLSTLSKRLGRLNGSSLSNFSSAMKNLSDGMKNLQGIKAKDFTPIANGIQKFEKLNTGKITSVGGALQPLADGINTLSNTNFDNKNLQNLINSLTRLSNANVSGLANVDFTAIGNSIKTLTNSLTGAEKVQQSTISITNAVAKLAQSASGIPTVKTELDGLGDALLKFTDKISGASVVTAETTSFTQAIAQLASVGTKAATTAGGLATLAAELKSFMQVMATAPTVSNNIIQMTNALANLASQGNKVGAASNTITKGLNQSSTAATKATRSWKGLASTIGKFYATYFVVVRGIKSLWSAIESTTDYIEAYNYFNVAFDKIASEWSQDYEKYGYDNATDYAKSYTERINETLGKLSGVQIELDVEGKGLLSETGLKNLGLNIQEVTQYAAQLASVTNSIGLTGEASLAASSAFTKLAGDISSLFNVDYSDVSQNLQSGLIGQSRALYKYGIDITSATLQTYAYNLGLSKSVSEMTQAEKMQLRMVAIIDQSKVSWGDLANTINSPSNMIRQFTNNVKELGTVLGQLFVPILKKVLPYINGVTIALKRLVTNIAGFLGINLDLDDFGQGYNDLGDDIEDVADAYEDATSAAEEYKNQLLGFDEINKLSESTDSTSTGTSGSSIDLTDEILALTSEYDNIWNAAYEQMENNAQKIADTVEKALEPVKKIIEDFAIGDFFSAGEDVSNLVISINEFIAKAISSVDWEQLGKDVGEFLKGIKWLEVLESITEVIVAAFDGAIDFWFGSFKEAPFETALITAIGLWTLTGVGSSLASKINTALGTSLPTTGFSIKSTLKVIFELLLAFKIGDKIGSEIAKLLDDEVADILGDDSFFDYVFEFGLVDGLKELGTALDQTLREFFTGIPSEIQELADNINDTIEEINLQKLNLQIELDGIDEAAENIQSLADAYYALSQKTDLTDEDIQQLQNYKDKLSDFGINVQEYIDPETNAWIATREALDEVIESQTAHLKVLAYQDYIVEGEKSLIDLENEIADVNDEIQSKSSYQKIIDQIEKMQEAGYSLKEIYSIMESENALGYNEYFSSFTHADVKTAKKLYQSLQKVTNEYKKQEKYVSGLYAEVDILNGDVTETNEVVGKSTKQLSTLIDALDSIAESGEATTESLKEDFSGAASGAVKSIATGVGKMNDVLGSLNKDQNINVNTSSATTAVSAAVSSMNAGLELIKTPSINVKTSLMTTGVSSAVTAANKTLDTFKTPNIGVNTSSVATVITNTVTKANEILGTFKTPNITAKTSLITTGITNAVTAANKTLGTFKTPSIDIKTSSALDKVNTLRNNIETALKGINIGLKIDVQAKVKDAISTAINIGKAAAQSLGTIKAYSTGGFPEDGWFRASKGEYFGKFDDGTNYIANNNQIESGIASAIYPAVYNAVVSAMSQSNNSSNGDVIVQIDGKNVFRAVKKQADNYTMQTGKSAFNI